MFVYVRSAAFVVVVTQKLVLQQSKNVTAKCTETLSPPPPIQFSLGAPKTFTSDVGTPDTFISDLGAPESFYVKELCLSYTILETDQCLVCKSREQSLISILRRLRFYLIPHP